MEYIPQPKDTIYRDGHEPLTIEVYTKSSATYSCAGVRDTQPRALFDPTMERTFAAEDTVVMRDGVQVYPPLVTLVGGDVNAPDTGDGDLYVYQPTPRDTSHLNALELSLSNERERLRNAKTDKEKRQREVWVGQMEREVAGEREFLGLPPATESTTQSDVELLAALGLEGGTKQNVPPTTTNVADIDDSIREEMATAAKADPTIGFMGSQYPVNAEAVDAYGIKLPEGYVKQGDPSFDSDQTVTTVETRIGSSGSHNLHARLSPSSSKTWTNCTLAPAYVEANKHRIPKDSGSIYSNEGTEAHDHAADVLLFKKTLDQIPEEMRDAVAEYVRHCSALVPDGVSYQVEVSIPLFYQPDESGTCDFAIVTDDRVTVRDYKHGAGVLVTSAGNSQLAIYAYSLIKTLEDIYEFTDDTIIDIKVVQPRHREADADEAWVLPLSEFRAFCFEIETKARIATLAVKEVRDYLKESADMAPSEVIQSTKGTDAVFLPQEGDEGSCRWCKAKAFCGVRHTHTTGDAITSATLALMPDLTKDELKGDPATVIDAQVVTDVPAHMDHGGTLPIDYLLGVFKNRKKIEKFLSDVEDYLENLAREQPIRGLKWVKGREGNRAWVSEETADTFLKGKKLKQDERYNYKLKSPTQIEAILKDELKNRRTKNRFEELISRSDGRPVLVPEEDKRAALPAPGDVMPNMDDDI